MDLERLRYQHHVEVVIYQDRPWLPRLFGNRFIRPVFVRRYTTNADWRDPRTLTDILMEQTRFDYVRGLETDLASFSMDVWGTGERGDPDCEPLLRGWRYTPRMTRSAATGATFAA